jgi:hypothetical protein
MSALAALVKAAVFNKRVLSASAFRALETVGPSDFEKMVPAFFFRFEAVYEVDEFYFFLRHGFSFDSDSRTLSVSVQAALFSG